jgi:hypothetical protein
LFDSLLLDNVFDGGTVVFHIRFKTVMIPGEEFLLLVKKTDELCLGSINLFELSIKLPAQ